jgi:UPF0716 protein FxsA
MKGSGVRVPASADLKQCDRRGYDPSSAYSPPWPLRPSHKTPPGLRRRSLRAVLFVFVLVLTPLVEAFVFIEVGLAIGWLSAVLLLVGTSLLGLPLLRIQGRLALRRVSSAVSEGRGPGRAALDGALGFLGCVLFVVPGLVTDVLGALLLLPPTRALARRWISRRYARRVVGFAGTAARFASRDGVAWPADVESTVEDNRDQRSRGLVARGGRKRVPK